MGQAICHTPCSGVEPDAEAKIHPGAAHLQFLEEADEASPLFPIAGLGGMRLRSTARNLKAVVSSKHAENAGDERQQLDALARRDAMVRECGY